VTTGLKANKDDHAETAIMRNLDEMRNSGHYSQQKKSAIGQSIINLFKQITTANNQLNKTGMLLIS